MTMYAISFLVTTTTLVVGRSVDLSSRLGGGSEVQNLLVYGGPAKGVGPLDPPGSTPMVVYIEPLAMYARIYTSICKCSP